MESNMPSELKITQTASKSRTIIKNQKLIDQRESRNGNTQSMTVIPSGLNPYQIMAGNEIVEHQEDIGSLVKSTVRMPLLFEKHL